MERISAEPVSQRDKALKLLTENKPFRHPELAVACLGGSSNSNSHGERSDIDITTVMKPENPHKVDVKAIIQLSHQIRDFFDTHNIPVVIISTIRLEEAQIAMAESSGKEVVPIHWLHYPSVEFAAANEPPELFLGLLSGEKIGGALKPGFNQWAIAQEFSEVEPSSVSHLAGLDWLTDSFRVLLTNSGGQQQLQPEGFLKGLAMHNLEYFWKWRVIKRLVEENDGVSFSNWADAEAMSTKIPINLWAFAKHIRRVRHEGVSADLQSIITLHRTTFSLWPV